MRILTRYFLRAHAAPFAFAVSALTFLMLLDQLGKRFGKLVGKGLDWSVIVEVFALSIPFILAMTLPMAVLLAVLYTFNRMAADNEITALKANGVHLPSLMAPVLVAATLLAGGMVWFNNEVLPDSNHRLQVLLTSISRKKPTFVLRERTINEVVQKELYIQVGRIDRETNDLEDVVIYDQREPRNARTIYADRGHMAYSDDRTDLHLTLHEGVTQQEKSDEPDAFQRIRFGEMVMRVPDVTNELERQDMETAYRGDRELPIGEMQEKVRQARNSARSTRRQSRELAVYLTRRVLGEELEPPPEPATPEPATPEPGADGPEDAKRRAAEDAERRAAGDVGRAAAAGAPPADTGLSSGSAAEEAGDGAMSAGGDQAAEGRGADSRTEASEGPDGPRADGSGDGATGRDRSHSGRVDRGDAGGADGRTDAADSGGRGDDPGPDGSDGEGSAAAAESTGGRLDSIFRAAAVDAYESAMRVRSARSAASQFSSLSTRARSNLSRANRYGVEIQKKFSIPAACIVFVLIGAPLAVRFREGGVAMVVAASLLFFCAYYVSLVAGEELADELILSPFWAMWAPNVLFGGIGLGLVWRGVKVG